MKINKKLISEAAQRAKLSLVEDAEGIDPNDGISEIAADVEKEIEATTDGAVTVSAAGAEEIAQEIKEVSAEVEPVAVAIAPAFKALGVKNRITEKLDFALSIAKKNKRRGEHVECNVLIVGLPGSGKTASINDWARSNGVNLFSVNAKDNDLEAYLNGYTVRDTEDPNYVKKALSKNLDPLDKPNSVLFLDEYNRQSKDQIRGALLQLIQEHTVVGNDENGKRYFPNLLFTIVCINPSVPTDKGATPLNQAEMSRLPIVIKDADSDPIMTSAYLKANYTRRINELDPKDEFYLEDLEDFLRCLDLGLFVMKHREFKYDGMDKLQDIYDEQSNMLNQRTFTVLLKNANGRRDAMIECVKGAGLLESTERMLINVLSKYPVPTFAELLKDYKIEAKPTSATTASKGVDEVEEFEDDEDLFGSGSGVKTTAKVKSPVETRDTISRIFSGI